MYFVTNHTTVPMLGCLWGNIGSLPWNNILHHILVKLTIQNIRTEATIGDVECFEMPG